MPLQTPRRSISIQTFEAWKNRWTPSVTPSGAGACSVIGGIRGWRCSGALHQISSPLDCCSSFALLRSSSVWMWGRRLWRQFRGGCSSITTSPTALSALSQSSESSAGLGRTSPSPCWGGLFTSYSIFRSTHALSFRQRLSGRYQTLRWTASAGPALKCGFQTLPDFSFFVSIVIENDKN